MRRLPVTESSKGNKLPNASTPVTTQRNRLMSWDSTVQGFTEPGGVISSYKNSITLRPIGFGSKIPKLICARLAKLPYTLFKIGYEIAKHVTRGLSSIRLLLFVAK
jgi:hypothetical protein